MLRDHHTEAKAMGKRYYQVLRDAYQDMSPPSKRLKPDEDQDSQARIDQTLKDACLGISGSQVDIGLMTDFVCSGSKQLTQVETALMYQLVVRLDVCIDAHVGLIMKVMKSIHQTKLHQRMKKELAIVKDLF